MLELLLSFHLVFMNGSAPSLATTTPGSYVEPVRFDYDKKTNQTYMTIARYNVNTGAGVSFSFMQSIPFAGTPAKDTMVKTIVSDPYIKTIEK